MILTSARRWRLKQSALIGAVVGVVVSQYWPLWGDTKQLHATPWTLARKTLITTHIPFFVVIALGIGFLISHIRDE